MGEPLKFFFSPSLVRRLAGDIARVHPAFPVDAFVRQACRGLGALELLDRGRHIESALARHLPQRYTDAIDVLLRSLGPEHATDELIGAGMAPFFYLPHVLFIAGRGIDEFDLSMRAQYELTKRFSAEASMRPYIAHDPERTFRYLRRWTRDPNAHVRRLVSECTRLRLPWAPQVSWLGENPGRVLELLVLLRDDPSTMVRRSVANNLNDLGKVHPDLLVRTCEAWLADASDERRALVEHALRSAIKRGDGGALRLLGYGKKPAVKLQSVQFDPPKVPIGGRVVMCFALSNELQQPQDLLVDVAVHFVKGNGRASPKIFKLRRVKVPGRGRVEFEKSFSMAVHTTRVPRPGRHEVDVLINGQPIRAGSFTVLRRKRALS